MNRFCLIAAFSALGALGLSSHAAWANGRFPEANQLVITPGHPGEMWLRTTFGLFHTSDAGAHFQFICERALGLGSAPVDPPIAVTGGQNLLLGAVGLSRSSSDGCQWSTSSDAGDALALAGRVITDVTVRPDRPHVAIALTASNSTPVDGGVLYNAQLFVSSDDGATFTSLGGPLDQTLLFETVEVAASDASRIYLSGIRPSMTDRRGVVLVSTDAGASFVERPLPYDATLADWQAFVAAVDPSRADRLYVRTLGTGGGRLLVSDDAGQSFREVFRGGRLAGFALSPDGGKVYVGGPTDGLWSARTDDLVFSQVTTLPILCLQAATDQLLACSSIASGFALGKSTDGGASFQVLLSFETVNPVACPSDTTAASCSSDWASLKETYGWGQSPVDAGMSPPSDHGCETNAGKSSGLSATLAASGLVLLLLWLSKWLSGGARD